MNIKQFISSSFIITKGKKPQDWDKGLEQKVTENKGKREILSVKVETSK